MRLTKNQRAVLQLLSEAAGELAAVELANGFGEWSRAGAYLALAQLERLGLVQARWDLDRSRPRRVYHSTAEGKANLHIRAAKS